MNAGSTEARPRYANSLRRDTSTIRHTALVIVLALGSTLGTPAFSTKSVEGNSMTTTVTVTEQSPAPARVGRQMGFIIT